MAAKSLEFIASRRVADNKDHCWHDMDRRHSDIPTQVSRKIGVKTFCEPTTPRRPMPALHDDAGVGSSTAAASCCGCLNLLRYGYEDHGFLTRHLLLVFLVALDAFKLASSIPSTLVT